MKRPRLVVAILDCRGQSRSSGGYPSGSTPADQIVVPPDALRPSPVVDCCDHCKKARREVRGL